MSDINEQIENAAEKLPPNWNIEIEVECGWAGVHLKNPKGEYCEVEERPDNTLAEDVEQAIYYALAHCLEFEEG